MQDELTAGGARIGGHDGDLDAELVGGAGLAFADALNLGNMEGIQLPAALALLLGADLVGLRQRPFEHGLEVGSTCDLAPDVADEPAEPRPQDAPLPMVALELLGMA
jgi:hypothetical protein